MERAMIVSWVKSVTEHGVCAMLKLLLPMTSQHSGYVSHDAYGAYPHLLLMVVIDIGGSNPSSASVGHTARQMVRLRRNHDVLGPWLRRPPGLTQG